MMIEYSKRAVSALSRLDVPTKQRIKAAVEKLPPDDMPAADEAESIQIGRGEFARGESVRHEDINWN
jgi:hypothetical protein